MSKILVCCLPASAITFQPQLSHDLMKVLLSNTVANTAIFHVNHDETTSICSEGS